MLRLLTEFARGMTIIVSLCGWIFTCSLAIALWLLWANAAYIR